MFKFSTFVLTVCALLTVLFAAACSSAAPTATPAPTRAPAAPTAAPAATNAPSQPNAASGIVTATPANSDAAPAAPLFTKINLNTATPDQILTIPNTGNRMVREFQEYRPYTSITQFRREIGKYVDDAQVAEYEKYVYVPVDVNQADAATLQQIPGVTADIAGQLIAARPYGTNQNFLAKLVTLVSPEAVTLAENYLVQ